MICQGNHTRWNLTNKLVRDAAISLAIKNRTSNELASFDKCMTCSFSNHVRIQPLYRKFEFNYNTKFPLLLVFTRFFIFGKKIFFKLKLHVTLTSCERTSRTRGDSVRSCMYSSRFVGFYQYVKISCFSQREKTLGSQERHSSCSESVKHWKQTEEAWPVVFFVASFFAQPTLSVS